MEFSSVRFCSFLFLTFIAALSPSLAQQAAPDLATEMKKYLVEDFKAEKLLNSQGLRNFRLKIGDDREAMILYRKPIKFKFVAKLGFTENLCPHISAKAICDIQSERAVSYAYLGWTKHPNPEKLGQQVNYYGFDYGTLKLEKAPKELNQALLGGPSVPEDPFFAQAPEILNQNNLKPAVMTCNTLKWLPTDFATANEVQVQAIHAESMTMNPETKLNENQILMSFENVTFEIDRSKSSLKAKVPQNSSSDFFWGLFGTSTNFMFPSEKGICQISGTIDTRAVIGEFDQAIKKAKNQEIGGELWSSQVPAAFSFYLTNFVQSAQTFGKFE